MIHRLVALLLFCAFAAPSPAGTPLDPIPSWYSEEFRFYQELGTSVASAGDFNRDGYPDVVVGGACNSECLGNGGTMYVFYGGGPLGGGWPHEAADVVADEYQLGARHGRAVCGIGDVNGDGFDDVLVGAPGFDNTRPDEGRAIVYFGAHTRTGGMRTYYGGGPGREFGYAVDGTSDLNGDGVRDFLIGAPGQFGETDDTGAVYLYLGLDEAPLVFLPPEPGNRFGEEVAGIGDINGDGYDDFGVGAPLYTETLENEGAAFFYAGGPDGPGRVPDRVVYGGRLVGRFGHAIAGIGDANGDGYDDVAVGAPEYRSGSKIGRTVVYFGGPNGVDEARSQVIETRSDRIGHDIAYAGDLNADGFGDMLLSTRHTFYPGRKDVMFVYLGGRDGFAARPDQTIRHDRSGDYFAYTSAVTGVGDVDNDGYPDVLLANSRSYTAERGELFLYRGNPPEPRLEEEAVTVMRAPEGSGSFGDAAGFAGDVDGDGRADIVVGAPRDSREGPDAGAAWLALGVADTTTSRTVRLVADIGAGAAFGHAVSGAGDFDGDGVGDVVVSAPHASGRVADAGIVYFYRGSSGGADSLHWAAVEGIRRGGQFGHALDSAGDANGDGRGDVIVGAFRGGSGGRAHVYYGNRWFPSDSLRTTLESPADGAWFGYAVAGAGDINGDGYGDVVVAAPRHTTATEQDGAVFVYLGGEDGMSTEASAVLTAGNDAIAGGHFGIRVACAGDVTGDGLSDILVACGATPVRLAGRPSVYLFAGAPDGVPLPIWQRAAPSFDSELGTAILGLGDVDGDGFGEFAIGDPGIGEGGEVSIFGGAPVPGDDPARTVAGTVGERVGGVLAAPGDVNGDGLSDVIWRAGDRIDLLTTRSAPSAAVLRRQFEANGGPEVSAQGYSGTSGRFRLEATVQPPPHALSVVMEYQVSDRRDFAGEQILHGLWTRPTPSERAAGATITLAHEIQVSSTWERVWWRVRIRTENELHHPSRWTYHAMHVRGGAPLRLGVAPGIPRPPDPPAGPGPPPPGLVIESAWPNPFNPRVTISYSVPWTGAVDLSVYDVAGRRVATIERGTRTEGTHTADWNGVGDGGSELASGVYFLRLSTPAGESTRKVTLVR